MAGHWIFFFLGFIRLAPVDSMLLDCHYGKGVDGWMDGWFPTSCRHWVHMKNGGWDGRVPQTRRWHFIGLANNYGDGPAVASWLSRRAGVHRLLFLHTLRHSIGFWSFGQRRTHTNTDTRGRPHHEHGEEIAWHCGGRCGTLEVHATSIRRNELLGDMPIDSRVHVDRWAACNATCKQK